METDSEKIKSAKKRYNILSISVSSLLVLSAVIYLVAQFIQEGKISDVLFVSLTLFESLFVLFAGSIMMNYISGKGISFYTSLSFFTELEKPKDEIDKLIAIFNHFTKTWYVILIWAICMGISPYFQGIWKENLTLRILFGVFLFFTNIITSYFVILLIHFFIRTRKLWSLIKVELWNRENPAAKFIFSASKWTAIIASVYIASSLTAWNTSENIKPFGNVIMLFFIFSIALLMASIIIPIWPYIKKIRELKTDALSDIDVNIQTEYSALLDEFKNDKKETKFDKMTSLIEMRNKIESIGTFPFQLKAISAAISITIITLLPKFIELLLKYIFQ